MKLQPPVSHCSTTRPLIKVRIMFYLWVVRSLILVKMAHSTLSIITLSRGLYFLYTLCLLRGQSLTTFPGLIMLTMQYPLPKADVPASRLAS